MSTFARGEGKGTSPFTAARMGLKRWRRRLRRRLRRSRRLEGSRRPHARRYRYVGVLKLLLPAIAALLVVLSVLGFTGA